MFDHRIVDGWLGHENAKRCFKDLELLEFEGIFYAHYKKCLLIAQICIVKHVFVIHNKVKCVRWICRNCRILEVIRSLGLALKI